MKKALKRIMEWLNPPVQEKIEVHEGIIQSKYRKENPPYGGTPMMVMMARHNYERDPDSRDLFMVSVAGKTMHIEKRIWDNLEVGKKVKITYRFPEPGGSLISVLDSALKTKCFVEYDDKVESF